MTRPAIASLSAALILSTIPGCGSLVTYSSPEDAVDPECETSDDCADLDDACVEGACVFLDRSCEGDEDCPEDRAVCHDGECVACRPGATRCAGEDSLERCVALGDGWEVEECLAGQRCEDDSCRVCRAGQKTCTGERSYRMCASDGRSWEDGEYERGLCVEEPMSADSGRGGACEVQESCFDCQGCRKPHAEVCVEGWCWLSGEPDFAGSEQPRLASLNLIVELSRAFDASTLRSASIRILHPRRTDGSVLTCDQLLEGPFLPDDDETLNRLRVLNPPVNLSTRDEMANLGVGHVPIGDDRLFLVGMHRLPNGEGSSPMVGCKEGLAVTASGQTVSIAVEVR